MLLASEWVAGPTVEGLLVTIIVVMSVFGVIQLGDWLIGRWRR